MSLPGQEGNHWFQDEGKEVAKIRSINIFGVLNNTEVRLEYSGSKRDW